MNILVVYGSKRGGTAGIASRIGDTLREAGFGVDILPAREVRDVRRYAAVVVGGALYAMHWHKDARRFVLRHAALLRDRPVWFFSSGPLDDSASREAIPPVPQVQQLMDFVSASGHATFGGRLARDAHGFIASAMARKHAGDWRSPERIEDWAREIGSDLDASQARTGPRPARPAPKPLPARATPVALCLVAGVSALFGGVGLVSRPDGSLLGMPLSLLRHSPFHDFLVPGLLLLVVIGLGNAWAAFLQVVRSDFAGLASFASGSALVVWIVVEVMMLRSFHWLHATYLVLGVWIVAESIRQVKREVGLMTPPGPGSHAAPSHG